MIAYNFITSFYYLIELNKNVIQDKYAENITINIMSTVYFLYEVMSEVLVINCLL